MRTVGCISLLLLLCTAQAGFAQVEGSISGSIVDTSGAAGPGVVVKVASVETGSVRTLTTDERGSYRTLALPVIRHEMRAEKTGFQTALRTGIALGVTHVAQAELELPIGGSD